MHEFVINQTESWIHELTYKTRIRREPNLEIYFFTPGFSVRESLEICP